MRTHVGDTTIPLLLCGDFNASPHEDKGSAYYCFTGTLPYMDRNVDRTRVSPDDFQAWVRDEPWKDCLAAVNQYGCTN
ncbi:hypothetical protein, partial [Rhizobium pisi]|uniref:hypothetical protein n=1 Tax=Rhizobium pisi TaxID=574561 RepID=UPI003D02326D